MVSLDFSPISEIDLYKLPSFQKASFLSPFALRINRPENCRGFCVYFNFDFSKLPHKVKLMGTANVYLMFNWPIPVFLTLSMAVNVFHNTIRYSVHQSVASSV